MPSAGASGSWQARSPRTTERTRRRTAELGCAVATTSIAASWPETSASAGCGNTGADGRVSVRCVASGWMDWGRPHRCRLGEHRHMDGCVDGLAAASEDHGMVLLRIFALQRMPVVVPRRMYIEEHRREGGGLRSAQVVLKTNLAAPVKAPSAPRRPAHLHQALPADAVFEADRGHDAERAGQRAAAVSPVAAMQRRRRAQLARATRPQAGQAAVQAQQAWGRGGRGARRRSCRSGCCRRRRRGRGGRSRGVCWEQLPLFRRVEAIGRAERSAGGLGSVHSERHCALRWARRRRAGGVSECATSCARRLRAEQLGSFHRPGDAASAARMDSRAARTMAATVRKGTRGGMADDARGGRQMGIQLGARGRQRPTAPMGARAAELHRVRAARLPALPELAGAQNLDNTPATVLVGDMPLVRRVEGKAEPPSEGSTHTDAYAARARTMRGLLPRRRLSGARDDGGSNSDPATRDGCARGERRRRHRAIPPSSHPPSPTHAEPPGRAPRAARSSIFGAEQRKHEGSVLHGDLRAGEVVAERDGAVLNPSQPSLVH
eukprot:365442-Chlamydomonas_euryale.AAC.11